MEVDLDMDSNDILNVNEMRVTRLLVNGVEVNPDMSGLSAYQIWLQEGNSGTAQDFLDSLVGPQGPQGIQGPEGPQGPQGPAGTDGTDGTNGADGVDGQDGADGSNGNTVAQLTIYRRATSDPATPSGGQYNFDTNVITPPSGWSPSIPSGTDPIYASVGQANIVGTSGTDTSIPWSQPEVIAQNGQPGADGAPGNNGSDGLSTYEAVVFRRAATQPTTPADDSASYNFTTNTLTPPPGWSNGIPAGTDPVWATYATFVLQGATGTDSTQSWTIPVLYVQNGDDGTDGRSTYFWSVYQRAAAPPATPTGGSFNFGTNTANPPSGWFTSIPAGSNPCYVSTTLASISGDTGTDSSLTWSSPVVLVQNGADGVDGSDGNQGVSVAQLTVYKRSATAAGTPTGGSYNFGTNTLTAPSTWSTSIPVGGDPVYASTGLATSPTTTGIDNSITWESSEILAQNGEDGTDGGPGANGSDGLSVYQAIIFQRGTSTPATPTGGSFDFGANSLTPPSGWSDSPPGGSDPLYASRGTFSLQGATGVDNTVTWSAPAIYTQDGEDGSDGADGRSTYLFSVFQRAENAPSTPTGGQFDFGNNAATAPSGWSTTVPASGFGRVWVSTALASVLGTTGIDNTLTWSSPVVLAEDGDDGDSGTADLVSLPSRIDTVSIGALPQTATIVFNTDGTITVSGSDNLKWNTGSPNASLGANYEVRCSELLDQSWDINAASVGTWIDISSNRTWSIIRTVMEGSGQDVVTAIFQIRASGTTTILDSCTVHGDAADA